MPSCPACDERYEPPAPRFCGRCGTDLARARPPGDGERAADAMPDPMPDPMIGRVVAGRYRVLERIGAGGMGVVYKCEHLAMGKIAALKMLHPTLSTERDLVKRFRTEARAVSLLTHPNTVQVFDFGAHENSLFMVMELVRGEELSKLLAREGRLPWRRAALLLIQICDALAEAHEAGVVHRDLKPENLLVRRGRDGREVVKVLDFGLAKLRDRGDLPAGTTGRGGLMGTPYFMAPEQIRGEGADPRSDLYALGAIAYRMLTGALPFDGETPVAIFTAHLSATLVPPSERQPALLDEPACARIDALVARCLARDPGRRFGSADELRRAIEAALDQEPDEPARAVYSSARGDETGPFAAPILLEKLSRRDFDRFEHAMRRRRFIGVGTVAAVLGLGAAAAALVTLRAEGRPVDEEVEPNDTPAQANLAALGRPVRGHVGKRLSVENSDRDVFRFVVPPGSPEVLRAVLSPIPDMDLHLAIFDGRGARLAESDAGGPGDGELIPNLRLAPGEHFATVREVWIAGARPTENVTDWYSLELSLRPLAAAEESEPDDTPGGALALPLGRPVEGYLARANDVDWFYLVADGPGAGARIDGTLSGIPGVDVVLAVLPPGSAPAGDPLRTPGARVFDGGGAGAGESFRGVPWPAGGAAPLVVVARKDPAPATGARRATLPGVDVRYTLVVERSAAAR